jgi:hypothetical protein
MRLIIRIKTKSVPTFGLLLLFALYSCNIDGDRNDIIELEIGNIIQSYNDSTFVSYGVIEKLDSNHFIICDIKNRWIGVVDENYKNLQIIGKQGRGGEEYPNLVSKIFTGSDSNEVFMLGPQGVLYLLCFHKDSIERRIISLDKIRQKGMLSSIIVIDNNVYCIANPEDESLFIEYQILDGEITCIGKKSKERRNNSKNNNVHIGEKMILTRACEDFCVNE